MAINNTVIAVYLYLLNLKLYVIPTFVDVCLKFKFGLGVPTLL